MEKFKKDYPGIEIEVETDTWYNPEIIEGITGYKVGETNLEEVNN